MRRSGNVSFGPSSESLVQPPVWRLCNTVNKSPMDEKCNQLWQKLSAALKPQVSPDTFKRLFLFVNLTGATDKTLSFRVPNNIYQYWIESNHMAALQAAVLTALGEPRGIKFTSSESPVEEIEAISLAKQAESGRETKAASGSSLGLNPRNTFESFVIGPNNEIAHAASLAVAQSPARTYNPLFIYGGVNLVKFRKRYRQADLLCIDDIQFLGGKERSQEEFFHTFNTLFDGHKQIVLSSDRPASEIANLEHRLVSRFEWGLTAELQPPDIETRLAILRKKAHSMQIKLRDDIFQFLASRIRTNVRRLEGALMRVASFASLSGKELTQEVIEHLLKDILQEEGRHSITIEQIQRRVAEQFDVRVADMTSKRRPASIAFPRQVAMYLARELTKASLNEIGEAFGGRDHGTVLHACKLVKKRMTEQDNIRQTISFIDSSLQR